MVKRKLTHKQVRNQAKKQADRIERAKKADKKLESKLHTSELGPEQEGLLIAHHGVHLIVEDQEGQRHQCQCRQTIGPLVTGDKVIWRAFADGTGVIVAMHPRETVLMRPSGKHELRPQAANVDLIVIVIAPKPAPSETTLDRYLVISELLKIPCLIVLNKTDLLEQENEHAFLEHMKIYQALDYPWLKVSTKDAHGLKALEKALKDKTSIFVGQSGVGKSSLIKTLIPDLDILIGDLSALGTLGKHTTTAARLYHLPEGGNIIDSPGIRRFGLWHLPKETLIKGFKEFQPFIGQCKFRNCAHKDEPGCALIKAQEQGHIHPKRLEHYQTLLEGHDHLSS